jgi:diphthamide biosynthesis protein 7
LSTESTQHAILDLHFSTHRQDVFATANSTGSVSFYRLLHSENGSAIEALRTVSVTESPDTLVLSFQWHPVKPHCLGITLSTGAVDVLQLNDVIFECLSKDRDSQDAIEGHQTWLEHKLEAWTVAFSPSGSFVFSGGDDGLFLMADLSNDDTDNLPIAGQGLLEYGARRRKIHQAGVTSILPITDDLCITGSYDDYIRVIGIPEFGHRQLLAEENLEGGVWRLKWLRQPDEKWQERNEAVFHVLASCMHAGARVLRVTKTSSGQWQIEVKQRFEEHQSMNYGSDFVLGTSNGRLNVVSTSFYDKLVCLWESTVDEIETPANA